MPVVLLDAIRTPFGAVHRGLAACHPVELLVTLLQALGTRTPAAPAEVREVVVGCVEQVGAQGGDVARAAVLAAGWPVTAGGTTLDRAAVSGPAALAHVAALIAAGAVPVGVAAAVDLPSLVPPGAAAMGRYPYGRPWEGAAAHHPLLPPGRAAERLGVGRDRQDAWAVRSLRLATESVAAGAFRDEIVGVEPLARDEVPASRVELLADPAAVPPMFDDDGTVTAANSAPEADGAAAVLLADAAWAQAQGLEPLATLAAVELRAGAPHDLLGAAAEAATAGCERAGITLHAVDAVELPEPFAALAVALADLLGLAGCQDLVNAAGGALALGDPTATSGLRSVITLAHRLRRADQATGLAVAAGLGDGAAVVLRREPGITSM